MQDTYGERRRALAVFFCTYELWETTSTTQGMQPRGLGSVGRGKYGIASRYVN
jgi:hypothetical protein